MKLESGPFRSGTANVILSVAAFFLPWLHAAILFSATSMGLEIDQVTPTIFFVILPVPFICLIATLVLIFSEKPGWKRPAVCFLYGSVLYSPVLCFLIYWFQLWQA
ncbi:hypothetical protein B1R32_10768 [Abditibacterium utsteinense]|uniref:Uncharacterized protein n=1 Tax=Abditibacterium utsteinense TaxID=1960156 RepID=A0A2S8STB5_9BACT|nr:hypothetical protein [Abditibacterium utsteinense]PQV64043.1 hypothetical protein B1R32_10768 [Abditibacterium utsteinense]